MTDTEWHIKHLLDLDALRQEICCTHGIELQAGHCVECGGTWSVDGEEMTLTYDPT